MLNQLFGHRSNDLPPDETFPPEEQPNQDRFPDPAPAPHSDPIQDPIFPQLDEVTPLVHG